MDLKRVTPLLLLSPLLAAGASTCIVSGSTDRAPTHWTEATAVNAAAFDLRAGGSGGCVHIAAPADEFEARAWSCACSAEGRTLNCLPPAMMIIFR